ncbi:hypothetical protein ABWK49_21750, partial [Priestia megaterium]
IAYTLNTSAYQSEVFRSSIQTIDRGQFEAAYSIGMTTFQAIKKIGRIYYLKSFQKITLTYYSVLHIIII